MSERFLTLDCRYIELTEEDKEKLKGSYKVAKKLEKLENRDKNPDSDEEDDYDCDPGEYPSLDSFTSNVSDPSPASPETSLSPRPSSSPRSGPSPGIANTGNYSGWWCYNLVKLSQTSTTDIIHILLLV